MYPEQARGPARLAVGGEADGEHARSALTAQGGQGLAAELAEELQRASVGLETASPEEIITWAVEHHFPRLTMATAFGPEGCVILSMLARVEPRVYVFNLDTGYQFQETLTLRDRIAERYGIEVALARPELSVAEYEKQHGGPLYERDSDRCCFDRKIKVLREHVQGFTGWMSGIRRDQSPHRAKAAIVGWDKKFGLVKISPLANWTRRRFGNGSRRKTSPTTRFTIKAIRAWAAGRALGRSCLARMSVRDAGAGRQKPSAVCILRTTSRTVAIHEDFGKDGVCMYRDA